MKKQSQTFFKQVYTKPSRTQSPDFRSSNSIRPTRSPDNIEYSLKQNDRAYTPIKNTETASKQYNTATTKYFAGNRSTIQANRSSKPAYSSYNTQQFDSIKSYCHECCSGNCHCVHATNNQEVVIQLKKIITMINGAAVSPFDGQNQTPIKQLEILKRQNNRLVELVEKLRDQSQVKQQYTNTSYQSEIRVLKQQLNQKQSQIVRQREQLYRANKTLSSQLKSLQDKYQSNQRQLESLRTQIKIRDELDSQRQADNKRKNPQQKMSWSIIKDQYKQQYNSSIKTLKSNMEFQINNQLSDYENQIRQLKIKVQLLQERLRNAQRVNQLNKGLNDQNNKLRKQIQQLSSSIKQSSKSDQPIGDSNNTQLSRLQRQNKQLNDYSSILTKQLSETKVYYQNQLSDLKAKNAGIEQKISKQTQVRVTKLMENYQQEIKILKNANIKASNVCNHKGIEDQNRNLKDQNEQNWQEVIRLRNQLVKYTSDNSKLENQINQHKNQISRLNHQINNDHLNLVARTTLLENENARLRAELENLMARADKLEQQNKNIKQQNTSKTSNLSNINALEYEIQELKNDLTNSKNNNQKLQQQNNKLFYEIDRLNSEHSKKQLEIRQNLKRQLQETKILYEDQINQAHEQYRQVSDELENLKLSYKKLQIQAQNLQQHQTGNQKQQDKKIRQHEITISNLSKIIEQTEVKMINLEQLLNKKQNEKQTIVKDLNQLKQQSDRSLRECIAYWQNQVRILKNNNDIQLANLRKQLADKDRQEQDIFMKMKTKMSVYQSESLRKELEELKKLVDEGRFLKIQEEFIKIVENYERQLIRSEQKTMEIDSLTKDKCALEEKNSDLEKLRLMLEQKTNILQGSIKVVQNELRQRKALCDSLLNQKVILEKQNLMLKKIKLDRETIQATKAKARQISEKIDKLLSMEEKREQNFIQASQVCSEVMLESRSKRLEI